MGLKKLSDIKKYENAGILVKFLKEEYVNSLIEGKLFMNRLGFFIDLEKKKNSKGQGDKYEGAFVEHVEQGYLISPETNEVLATFKKGTTTRRYENVKKVPVFCCTIFNSSDLHVVSETDSSVSVQVKLSEGHKENFLKDFGEKAVVLPNYFLDKIVEALTREKLEGCYGSVQYVDFSVGSEERKTAFNKASYDMFFWKDKYFEYQKEYRIAITNKFVEDYFEFLIGDINKKTYVMDTTEFFEEFTWEFPK
ncbi:hypothetical protein COL52_26705 [Bacillus toyonensis]|uniref:Uncharacterized protein n=1 Tax=Bacillus toyonensis TaxID=155322 RepID=A0A2B7VPQ5_9BACI|nr:hypothetical protein [Bacillus toyonensis]PFY54903.1 hypothetical protein COL52_26705 [Bacillus toyonensis]PGG86355.1 hypothetical protein CON73_23655 [Bacillus toyonensis]